MSTEKSEKKVKKAEGKPAPEGEKRKPLSPHRRGKLGLSVDTVKAIKLALLKGKFQREIAKEFGVSMSLVSAINMGHAHANVEVVYEGKRRR
jgi:hypothetical protein